MKDILMLQCPQLQCPLNSFGPVVFKWAKGNCAIVEDFSRSLWPQSCCYTGFLEEVYSLLKSRFAEQVSFSKTLYMMYTRVGDVLNYMQIFV